MPRRDTALTPASAGQLARLGLAWLLAVLVAIGAAAPARSAGPSKAGAGQWAALLWTERDVAAQANESERWYQNFSPAELWSGPDANAVSFGVAPQWDYFRVVQRGPWSRVRVFVARTSNEAFIEADALGPSGPPPPGWPAAAAPTPVPPDAAGSSALVQPSGIVTFGGFAIQAQRGFEASLRVLWELQHTWTLNALASTGTRLEWSAAMRPHEVGLYAPREALILINSRWAASDPRALAAQVEHEAKHVADWLAGEDLSTPRGCVAAEVRAFSEEAKTWAKLVGPRGKANPRDDLERSLNYKLEIYQQGPARVEAFILESSHYRALCHVSG